jgi:DNA-binding NtrC family response regulator
VRELDNTIRKALIFNRGTPISQEDIQQTIRGNNDRNSIDLEKDERAMSQ